MSLDVILAAVAALSALVAVVAAHYAVACRADRDAARDGERRAHATAVAERARLGAMAARLCAVCRAEHARRQPLRSVRPPHHAQ